MEVKDYLKDELKRLNRINNLLEEQMTQENLKDNKPEQIVNNAKAMCEIANIIYVYRCY